MPHEVQARQSEASAPLLLPLPASNAREQDKQQSHLAERIETLVQEIATFRDPRARATAEELVQSLLDMYGEGLTRLLEITAESEVAGPALIDTFARDELLSSLFVLHGLHPLDIESRILEALEQIQPSITSQGSTVEFVKFENGVAHVRLLESQGSGCQSCGTSPAALKLALEESLYKAVPDLGGIEVEGANNPPRAGGRSAMPITFVPPRRHKDSSVAK